MKKYKFDINKLYVSSNYTDLIPKNKKIAMLQIIINASFINIGKNQYFLLFNFLKTSLSLS
jgi:hypothetical protein